MKQLTEKDAIWCKTQKQWDSIIERFSLEENIKNYDFNRRRVILVKKGIWDNLVRAEENDYTIHQAKDILKKSFKKDVLKRLDNLEEERKNGNPIELLEKLLSEITPEESLKIKKDMISLALKGEPLKFELPTKELEELPEDWCVFVTVDNRNAIAEWSKNPNLHYGVYVFYDKKTHEVTTIKSKGFYIKHTEITFDQFKKWVLKEDDLTPVEKMLDVKEKLLSIREVQVKVSNQEEANECAEIAKACGEKISTLFLYPNDGEYFSYNYTGSNVFGFYKFDDSMKEIKLQEFKKSFGKKQETEIDWSKAGQLVKNTTDYFLITNGIHSKTLFEATPCNGNGKGVLHRGWVKESFKLCTEPITLKNE